MRSNAVTAASGKMAVFCFVQPCSLVEVYRFFRFRPRLFINSARNMKPASKISACCRIPGFDLLSLEIYTVKSNRNKPMPQILFENG